VFLDAERNIRLGDFGLATRHSSKLGVRSIGDDKSSEISTIYNAIEDITTLLGGSLQDSAVSVDSQASAQESLTGGVGTTFYRAPEQEGGKARGASDRRYDVQADIFSLGIVLFEIFHPPFGTYMERAEILNRLRGERPSSPSNVFNPKDDTSEWEKVAEDRFPRSFIDSTPKSAQKLILWCLQRDPTKRPTAEQILNSNFLPRKMELEQHYLEEALHTLANPQSESYLQILGALFARTTSDLVEVTFDADIAAKANNLGSSISSSDGGRKVSLSEGIIKAIGNIRSTGSHDTDYLRSVAMSSSSLIAATAALLRAKESGNISKGVKGILKRGSQRVAGIIAMNAATSAAVTGLTDGVHGADPRVVNHVCSELKAIFEAHGAVHLRSPLLRPKPNFASASSTGGLAEFMNSRGAVLVLPEDLTASFARAVGRGGTATSNIKRYDVSRVYHKSLVGGHPRESLEASFDITHEHLSTNSINVEAECILVLCNAITMVAPNRKEKIATPLIDGSPIWYLRLTHTRLADSILDVCGDPPKEELRRRCFQVFTQFTAPSTKAALAANLLVKTRSRSRIEGSYADAERTQVDLLEQHFAALIENGLPRGAAQRFHLVLSSGCCPLPTTLDDAVDAIVRAVGNLRNAGRQLQFRSAQDKALR
jgi:translation initiation factor 2-alpha kinase 4